MRQGIPQIGTSILWKRPPIDMFKITQNVVVDKGLGRIGIGIIVRDHDGCILAACSTTKNYMVEPIIAEALVALQAGRWNSTN